MSQYVTVTFSTMDYLSVLTIPALFLCAVLLWLAAIAHTLHKRAVALKDVPDMPNMHWLLGSMPYVRKLFEDDVEALNYIKYVSDNKIKMTKLWIGPFFVILTVRHCSLLPKVLKQPKNKVGYDLLRPWLGDGLLISEGNKWFRNRRLLTPAFHYAILMPYTSVYNRCLGVMMDKWSAAARVNDPVKLFECVSLLSLDIILQCSFSFSSDCQVESSRHPYIHSVQKIVELTTRRFTSLPARWDLYYYLTKDGRTFRKHCNTAHNYSNMVIQNRKKELRIGDDKTQLSESELRSRKKGKYLDFLDVLLIARDEEGNGLTDQEIRDEVDTFMFEGHDTTTSGMCWTLYCLAKHLEAQEKVREEVRSVLQGRETLDYDDIKELKYTLWAIKEAMRLYPPVFFISRETNEEFELDGCLVPKGVRVGIDIRCIHRQSDTWENPDEYDPLRFNPSNCEGRDPYAYVPFSGGQRNCIGQNFALNEERIVIASILNRFKISLVQGHKVEADAKIVLRSKNDIKINLEPLY